MFLLKLASRLPSKSPTDQTWIDAPVPLRQLSNLFKNLYHDVRCLHYRQQFDKTQQALIREKLIASQVSLLAVMMLS